MLVLKCSPTKPTEICLHNSYPDKTYFTESQNRDKENKKLTLRREVEFSEVLRNQSLEKTAQLRKEK